MQKHPWTISPLLLLRATKICLSVRPGLWKPWSSCSLQGSHIQSAGSQEPPENPALFKTHIWVLPNMLLNSACSTSELQSDQWYVPPCPTAAPTESKAEALWRHISSRGDSTNRKSCDVISQLSIYCKEILREQVTSLAQSWAFWPPPEVVWNRAMPEPAAMQLCASMGKGTPGELPSFSALQTLHRDFMQLFAKTVCLACNLLGVCVPCS